jgi:hypothetical protein
MEYRWIKENELNSYEKENKKLSYANLFYNDDSLILCNNIAYDFEELDQVNGFNDNDDYEEIYQYYIIDDSLANRLINNTQEIIYYHNKLDIYILGVQHYGTSWSYVLTDFKLEKVEDTEDWYKAVIRDDTDDSI